jgi:predicted AlkP superfamily pyrophosphatase or phosphodiesterase
MSDEHFEPKRFGDVYLPDYSGRSLYNLSRTLLRVYGAPVDGSITGISDVLNHGRIVLLLVDGLGYNQLVSASSRIPQVASALAKARLTVPLTSVFPSTTSTVLTTLNTGLTPARHGIIGFTMYVKELGTVVNSISFSPASERGEGAFERSGLQPSYLYPQRTIYQDMSERGAYTAVITPGYLANTVLSKTLYNGADRVKINQLSDLFVTLRKSLLGRKREREFYFAYWSGVDTIAHKYGSNSEEYDAELNSFFHMLNTELLERCRGTDTTLIVTADHGHVYIPQENFHDLSSDSQLLSALSVPPTGDSRALFMYPRVADEADRLLNDKFGSTSQIVDSDEALRNNFLGQTEVDQKVRWRVGQRIVLPFKPHSYVFRYPTFENKPLLGNHGGLTLDELLVPLVAYEL